MITNSPSFLSRKVHYNLPANELSDQTIALDQGTLNSTGSLVISTGRFTGRSPQDKFIVKDNISSTTVDWNNFNHPIDESYFLLLQEDMMNHLKTQAELWMRDVYACPDNKNQLAVRVINDLPWANLFVGNMFTTASTRFPIEFIPEWQIIHATGFKADPAVHGTRGENFAVLSFVHKTILIGGTAYTGEIKKGIFTILNFLLPINHDILGMHCSANVGANGDTALFFGLSGTGKTTLSTDPERSLVGDDEHGWADDSIFNFESGCYAKVINLSKENEPDIFDAIKPGALVENTVFFPGTDIVDFSNASVTENTRVSYPLSFIKNTVSINMAPVPKNIFFLSCDAYGILPPISKLTPQQAMYYFISGYTARIAGTEDGVKEPQATFSTCFGAPFLPLHPSTYAKILGEKIAQNDVKVWMVNTGWTGGAYGVGSRMKLSDTRAMINAALNGSLEKSAFMMHPLFCFEIPEICEGVDSDLLNPETSWSDKEKYWETAEQLVSSIQDNFSKYSADTAEEITSAGPILLKNKIKGLCNKRNIY